MSNPHASGLLSRRRGTLLFASVFAVALASTAARAEEPKGCDGFKWPLKREAALLQSVDKPALPNGGAAKSGASAFDLKLVDFDAAALPVAPERGPKSKPSNAGFIRFAAPDAAGPYQVTVSEGAWIDVVQDGRFIKPSAFTGATECPGVRKSIRVALGGSPFTVQISSTQASAIAVVVLPVSP